MIVNADSAQLYRDLDIVSARPTAGELRRAEHRLYGVRDGTDPCSAAAWAALARAEIAAIHAGRRLPILVGGTGLYLRTLIDGIAPIPPIEPAIREEVRSAPVAANHAALQLLDSEAAARLRPTDTTRIARALEVVRSTGRPIAAWQAKRSGGIGSDIVLHPVILLPPREWLYERCDARFATMLDSGGLKEIEALLARNLDHALPVMRAIGVAEIAAMLLGRASRDETLAAGARATRQYAKRQYTWFANQPPVAWERIHEVPGEEVLEAFGDSF